MAFPTEPCCTTLAPSTPESTGPGRGDGGNHGLYDEDKFVELCSLIRHEVRTELRRFADDWLAPDSSRQLPLKNAAPWSRKFTRLEKNAAASTTTPSQGMKSQSQSQCEGSKSSLREKSSKSTLRTSSASLPQGKHSSEKQEGVRDVKLECSEARLDKAVVRAMAGGKIDQKTVDKVLSSGSVCEEGNRLEKPLPQTVTEKEGAMLPLKDSSQATNVTETSANPCTYSSTGSRKAVECFDLHAAQGAFKQVTKSESRKSNKKHAMHVEHSTVMIADQHKGEHRSLVKILEHDYFEYVIGGSILLNAVVIGAQVEWQARNENEKSPSVFQWLEVFFTVLFSMELGMRMFVERLRFILGSGYIWNFFDTIIVSLALIDTIMWAASTSGEGMASTNVAAVRVLRIVRLFRAIRMIRVVRFFRDLRIMLLSIMNSFKTLFWSLLLIMMILYVIGIFITQVVIDHAKAHKGDAEDLEDLILYYGNLGKSILSLFKAISGGADWGDLADPLISHISEGFAPFFVLYVSFALLAVLNVVTGVFVESALASAQEDRDLVIQEEIAKRDSYVHEVRALFKEADTDQSGELSWSELEVHLHDYRVQAYFKALELDVSEAKGLFNLLDMDDTGMVSADEFVMGCMRLKGQAKSIDVATLIYENKRMAVKWNGFMQYVEKSFDSLNSRLRRGGLASRGVGKASSKMSGFPTVQQQDLTIEVEDWEHVFLEEGVEEAIQEQENEESSNILDEIEDGMGKIEDGMGNFVNSVKAAEERLFTQNSTSKINGPDDASSPETRKV